MQELKEVENAIIKQLQCLRPLTDPHTRTTSQNMVAAKIEGRSSLNHKVETTSTTGEGHFWCACKEKDGIGKCFDQENVVGQDGARSQDAAIELPAQEKMVFETLLKQVACVISQQQ
eukprot:4663335-Karenia_brevis.AAC.1